MEQHHKQFYRDQLRSARATALADSEGFQAVIHSLELIGQQLFGPGNGLGDYAGELSNLADASPFSKDIASAFPMFHTKFRALYDELRRARNDAVHQGAHARILAAHAVDLTIILEDALMNDASKVSQFMVREVVDAKTWHPVSYVRQQMLKYAFSYIPIQTKGVWKLIPEHAVAQYLRGASSAKDRKKRLVTSVCDAASDNKLSLVEATTAEPEDLIADILNRIGEHPILVVDSAHKEVLAGMLSSSDIL